MIEKFKYQQLTAEAKEMILTHNAARVFNIDIKAARKAVDNDFLYKLRQDGNPLPVTRPGPRVPGVQVSSNFQSTFPVRAL